MAIDPHLAFNGKEFEGFEDLGDTSTSTIADHAHVFMLRGINGKWKQPIAYTFSKSSTKTIDLVRILKAIIKECTEIGFKILATVSDQGSTNQAAINYLMKRSVSVEDVSENVDRKYFYIGGSKIVHIYDPPHLLKCIRNNLLTKNLIWEKESGRITAKWEDIFATYQMSTEIRSLPKLTEAHVNPENI
jgi:hypothetical protein